MQNGLIIRLREEKSMVWESMVFSLQEMISLCKSLLSEAEKKEQFLLTSQVGECADVFRKEEELINKLAEVHAAHLACLDTIKQEQDLLPEVTLIEAVHIKQPAESQCILTLVNEMEPLLHTLQAYTAKNQSLMERAKCFVDFNINVLTQAVSSDIYAPKGKEGAVVQGKKIFDQSI